MKQRFSYEKPKTIVLLVCLGVALVSQRVEGQAYCSLRDPNRVVQSVYPGATFRTFIQLVTEEHGAKMKAELPIQFDNREFGKHSLYAVVKGGVIEGFVQSRTEPIDWGLAEIIWVLDKDLRLKEFRFQRCRSRWRKSAENGRLQDFLRGMSEDELISIWNKGGMKGFVLEANLPDSADKLVEAVVKSAFKTMGLARLVWNEDIAEFRASISNKN
jgi:hypothetical protein